MRTSRALLNEPICRTRLWEGTVGVVEDLHCAEDGSELRSCSPDFQVWLPYRGLFVWHVGEDEVVADANQILFVSGGEPYRVTQPVPTDYAELIVTPDPELLDELAGVSNACLDRHPLFVRRSRRADLALLSLRARVLLNLAGSGEPLACDEMVIALLRAALSNGHPAHCASAQTQRLIRRTKEFVQEHLATPFRLRHVAAAVGASAAYLTDLFRRVEGVPLHRYVTQLRLARSLIELPHAEDLTALAFDLGFSSHSHFTAAFRKAFGCTPSEVRASARALRVKGPRAGTP